MVSGGPIAAPALADLQADPSVLDRTPVAALLALRHEARLLAAEIERALMARLLAEPRREGHSGEVGVLTTGRLAAMWGMKDSKIRQLCRSGRIPAKKLGGKEWVVPVDALREWATQGIADAVGSRHNSAHAGYEDAQGLARRHTVAIRRPTSPTDPRVPA